MLRRIPVLFFHDVLCAYCGITAERLSQLRREFGELLDISLRAYPLRLDDKVLTDKDLRRLARHVRIASREPEGTGYSAGIWLNGDPPPSSLPPLIALEAARAQGPAAQEALASRLRSAAFRAGLNVCRRDVILEAAVAAGLDVSRLASSLDLRSSARAVESSHQDAVGHGVRAIPSVVVGEEWMLTGVRETSEYRDVLFRWLERHGGRPARTIH